MYIIGGSLTKIAYYSTVSFRRVYYATDNLNKNDDKNKDDKNDKFVYTYSEQARLHFVKFETKYIENCLDFIGDNLVNSDERKGKSIKATGGGAYKYSKLIQDKLGLKVDKEDELTCLITGCNFLLKNISDEAFVYNRNGSPEYEFQTADPHVFPYMLVNIGSGVSILKVESDSCYERIGGTATGGGTFWGLGTLLTKAKSFDELLDLAEKGDHRKADMLVKDIYGGDYETLGMHSDLIASSFGKICPRQNSESDYNEADLARSLLFAISNDIGQIACLYAMMHNLKKHVIEPFQSIILVETSNFNTIQKIIFYVSDCSLIFSRLERELANELITVDLIILEGMGRAVHTNIDAEFVCDCFKLAIIKNRWLAKRLGGDVFSVVCKYESVA
ncbi:PREDICTED: pantothenate kinase 4-like [Diuraphis noxia]|uniref:pantothenate kinase 4-like n=1 Tax=Diuraphis noxia TaxID=143948 RepID=UPI000763AC45|nr:PREDICTED: pantothenate kinase 4-like [Diuraphis noxia]